VEGYLGGTWWIRVLLQRGIAAVYLSAFLCALNQFRPLLGEHGLLPVPQYLRRVPFRHSPSVFYLHYSDRAFARLVWLCVILSAALLVGAFDYAPVWLSGSVWIVLWLVYLSIVNVGQVFYGFGWETMLLEAGFFTAFLGPRAVEPSVIPILTLRWMLFRTEFGAGLIKLRHDACWRKLTCLYFHYETQPLPNPLSWYFHRLPRQMHRLSVLFSHFVQLVVPFGLFFPQPIAAVAGGLLILHQGLLIVSGNYSWLNWLTIVLGFSALGDSTLSALFGLNVPVSGAIASRSGLYDCFLYGLGAVTVGLSVQPTLNLLDKQQRMNCSYNPLHLVNSYGAFGSVTRERDEIVLEGLVDDASGEWRAYGFRGKPGDPQHRPGQVAPYHLRLDWMMWFLSLRTAAIPAHWFVRFVDKLLEGDQPTAKLLRDNPFGSKPPREIRASVYRYRYTTALERKQSGAWWQREYMGEFYRQSRP